MIHMKKFVLCLVLALFLSQGVLVHALDDVARVRGSGRGNSGIWYYYESKLDITHKNDEWDVYAWSEMASLQGTNVSLAGTLYGWDFNLHKTTLLTEATFDLGEFDSNNSRSIDVSKSYSSIAYDWQYITWVTYHVGSLEPGLFIGFDGHDPEWYEEWAVDNQPSIDYDNHTECRINVSKLKSVTNTESGSMQAYSTDMMSEKIRERHTGLFSKVDSGQGMNNKLESFDLNQYYYFNMIDIGNLNVKTTPFKNDDTVKALLKLQYFDILRNKATQGDETPSYWISQDGLTLYIGVVKKDGSNNLYRSNLKVTDKGNYYWSSPVKILY